MNKTLTAPEQSGELLRAGKILTITGNALVEWFESGVKQAPILVNGSRQFGPMETDMRLIVSAVSGSVSIGEQAKPFSQMITSKFVSINPRIVKNILAQNSRFLDATTLSGTATKIKSSPINANGVRNGMLALISGAAGRAFQSATYTLDADTWYALSIDISAISGFVSGVNSGMRLKSGGTAVIDNTTGDITEAKIVAGGNGRYAIVFRSILGGTIIPRIGLGLDSNTANREATIANLQLEKLSAANGLRPSEYVYPGYTAVFNTQNPNSLDENGKLTTNSAKQFFVKPFSNILCVGDSRSDEPGNIPDALNTLMLSAGIGGCNIHARGGLQTVHAMGPTVVSGANMTENVSVTFTEAIMGKKYARTFSTDGDEQIGDNQGMPFDTLFVCDFGYNDINNNPSAGDANAFANIMSMCDTADALGMNVILSDNNPFGGHATATSEKITAVRRLNQNLKNLASQRGYLFANVYEKLSDSTDINKLSDGLGTTPNYSQDLLHLNTAGSLLYATEVFNLIQANR